MKKNTKKNTYFKVGVSGVHGAGKSYKVLDLSMQYKKKYPTKTIHILQENVIKCPLSFNEKSTYETQLWIVADQIKAEIEACELYDIVICDRCVYDPIAYAMATDLNDTKELLWEFLKPWGKTYDLNYLMNGDTNNHIYDNGVRSIDPEFRTKVDGCFKELFYDLDTGGYLNEVEIL